MKLISILYTLGGQIYNAYKIENKISNLILPPGRNTPWLFDHKKKQKW